MRRLPSGPWRGQKGSRTRHQLRPAQNPNPRPGKTANRRLLPKAFSFEQALANHLVGEGDCHGAELTNKGLGLVGDQAGFERDEGSASVRPTSRPDPR